jgi:hypothetical protein
VVARGGVVIQPAESDILVGVAAEGALLAEQESIGIGAL